MEKPLKKAPPPDKNRQEVRRTGLLWWGLMGLLLVLVLVGLIYYEPIWNCLVSITHTLSDRENIQNFVNRFGVLGPVVFVVIQFLQVILAPIPGEATGFIGGYLFGALQGFLLSSLALALGSLANFAIGRLLGKRYVRRLIPESKLKRFDRFIKRQGVPVLLILFIFPGFPKDYLCLFLGLTALPIKVFFLIAAFGRMPGTLLLSLQGASLYEGNYITFSILVGVCLIAAVVVIRYREKVYQKVDNLNGSKKDGHNK